MLTSPNAGLRRRDQDQYSEPSRHLICARLDLLQGVSVDEFVIDCRHQPVCLGGHAVQSQGQRQTEDPEVTFANESADEVDVQRDTEQVQASEDLAEQFGLSPGDEVTHVVTRAAEAGHPISISDTYMPPGVRDSSAATVLEETVADRIPTPSHASWLQTTPGDLVKMVHQRFIGPDDQVIMVSDVSYAMDRYDALVFRMVLTPGGND